MTRRTLASLALVAAVLSTACGKASPDPGQVGVLIRKPIIFGSGGIDPNPVPSGTFKWTAATTTTRYIPTSPQQVIVTFNDIFTKDNVPLDYQSSVRYTVTDPVRCVKDYGCDTDLTPFFQTNIEQDYRRFVRDAVKKHGLQETASDVNAADEIDQEITATMTAFIKSANLPIHLESVTLGHANPPDAVRDQRIKTAAEQQRAITEEMGEKAELKRKAREVARAEADMAYRNEAGYSAAQAIEIYRLSVIQQACAKGGCTFLMGAGGVSPVLPLGGGK